MQTFEKHTLEKALSELYRLFKLLNKHFYANELETPVIVINFKNKRRDALDWCSTKRIWKDAGKESTYFYEMSISSELFNLPISDIYNAVAHEMVHLHNLQRGIKDTSQGKLYHNGVFKDMAIYHGLCVAHSRKYGWANTNLSEHMQKFIASVSIEEDAFRLIRVNAENINNKSDVKKEHNRKYQCPECGTSVRATKEVNIVCGDCNVKMISERFPVQTNERQPEKENIRKSIQEFKPR